MSITLGDEVIDQVSGFTGIAVARHSFLYGCDRISVQPEKDKDGKLPDQCTFDEPALKVKKKTVVKPKKEQIKKNPGGPEKYMPSSKSIGER